MRLTKRRVTDAVANAIKQWLAEHAGTHHTKNGNQFGTCLWIHAAALTSGESNMFPGLWTAHFILHAMGFVK